MSATGCLAGVFRAIKRLLICGGVAAFLYWGFKNQDKINHFLNPPQEKYDGTKYPKWAGMDTDRSAPESRPADLKSDLKADSKAERRAALQAEERAAYQAFKNAVDSMVYVDPQIRLSAKLEGKGKLGDEPIVFHYPDSLPLRTQGLLREAEARVEAKRLAWKEAEARLRNY